jgi:hypothetical protein
MPGLQEGLAIFLIRALPASLPHDDQRHPVDETYSAKPS